MKSQPDVARTAAEVVTQLPVPSRLGMLRFERLNEASWALLYLDPNCERQFGLPAVELCALIGSPYASLMEPQARYQLHDAIQQQLAESPHYLVRYTLHTNDGPLSLLELGEAYKQHNRHLLRGYLMVVDGLFSEIPSTAPTADLESQNSRLQIALELNQRAQQEQLLHLERVRAQQELILLLARQRYTTNNSLQEAAELITRSACDIYQIDCASIWNLEGQRLVPISAYQRADQRHHLPEPIDASGFPDYLEALQTSRAIDATNVMRDPRTREMAESLQANDVYAMLDASIRVDGQVVGVLCLEQSGCTRVWQSDEIAFAGELADQFAQVINNHNRRTATSALHLFQRAVEQSANAFLLVNCDGVVEYVNPSFTAITQYSTEEVHGHRLAQLPALENLSELLFDAPSSLAKSNSWQGEFKSRRKNLEPYWGQLSISKVYGDNRELTHYIGIYEDITQTKLAQQRIERLAYTDNLTNLGNRPAFIRNLDERFARDSDSPICLLLVDIDNFKRINDSLGHQTGDKLLISLARRLRNSLSAGGSLARFASNEFAVLLDDTDLESGQLVASQLLATLDKPMFVDNQLISVTGSVGLACAPLQRRLGPAQGQSQRQTPGTSVYRSVERRGQLQTVRGKQPAPRPDPERAGRVLPAQAVPAQWPLAGHGGAAALEPPGKGHDPPRPVHQRGRRNRPDHPHRQMDRPPGLPHEQATERRRPGQPAGGDQPVAQTVLRPGPGGLDCLDPQGRRTAGQPART
jgi:diguanylate cyclase (GGDEF)-like protein/PAS domain S-box-containing protein